MKGPVCVRERCPNTGGERVSQAPSSVSLKQRSDVVAVVEIGWVQAVVMPLAPLLDGLPASLFLFWGQEMKSLCEDGGLGSGHSHQVPPKYPLCPSDMNHCACVHG